MEKLPGWTQASSIKGEGDYMTENAVVTVTHCSVVCILTSLNGVPTEVLPAVVSMELSNMPQ